MEVSVLAVRRAAIGGFDTIPMGTPWNLVWAHSKNDHVLPRLPVSSQRHIDLGHIVDPAKRSQLGGEDYPDSDKSHTLFCLAFFVKSNSLEYLLDPGSYQIDFQVFSATTRPSRVFTLHLNHTGEWFEDEDRMYNEGLGLKIT